MSDRDEAIVRAAIYPAIGIARVGNSAGEYFIGPEVIAPEQRPAGFYKDGKGALKRQAARFRLYGLDAAGEVVRELTAADARITWRVHVANKKAAWFEFDVAMDIPQARPVPLRNANVQGEDRRRLIVDPGPVTIAGADESGPRYRFDKGAFLDEPVYLGELRTDEQGRLLFLGGHGISHSPYPHNPPVTFANNDGWCDDVSDGPVDADVTYQGRALDVEGAWVVCAPPNYAPDLISVQTMYDVISHALSHLYVTPATRPSFTEDIYPLLLQLSMTQWVNQGFYVAYGYKQAYDFTDGELIRRLSTITRDARGEVTDDYREYRRQIFNSIRPAEPTTIDPRLWPWMYGDNMTVPAATPNAYFSLTKTLYGYLTQWMQGDFARDWRPDGEQARPRSLAAIADPRRQAAMLTKAALWYCLGGPFHPGCEMTWPMRLPGMYSGPFRIRRRSPANPEPAYGPLLTPDLFQDGQYFTTPPGVLWNGPGDLTRWMACPWQADTASCRSGYEDAYDPLVPTFWPAHVPNTVLTARDYERVMDPELPRQERLDAFNRRASWYRILGDAQMEQIAAMIDRYGDLGVVEYRPGVPDDPELPAEMYVESRPYAPGAPGAPGAPVAASPAAGASASPPAEAGLLTAAEAPSDEASAREAMASRAEAIPYRRGLYVGPVGRAARRR